MRKILLKNPNTGATLPVVVGLAAGIALLVTLSIAFAGPSAIFGSTGSDNKMEVALEGLKSTYESNERIAFSVVAKGVSSAWCNDYVPSVTIVGLDGRTVWSSNPFNTALLCSERLIESQWQFGNENPTNRAENGVISINQAGLYKVIASYEDATAEEEILVRTMVQDIDLTFDDLKSEYGQGEHITFSVKAEGISETACNDNVPSVNIRDYSNREVVWSSKLVLNRMLLCDPEHIDKQWQFGNQLPTHTAENGRIAIDKAGSYIVVAMYDGVSVEKKFTIK